MSSRAAMGALLPLAVLCAIGGVARADPAPARFSIAIGYNFKQGRPDQTLRYADDDAVRNHRMMQSLGAESVLLAHLDNETREIYRDLEPTAPTPAAIEGAIDAINRRIEAARRAGRRSVLYLFYSGHGDVDRSEGYVQLQSARLTRSALLALLRRSKADHNHVIIDACKSYFVVFARGPGGKRQPARGGFLGSDERPPDNTGFLLSTSSAQDSHEWEAYQGGIFSHEVRSALRGAADVDGDGVITYEETAAFIHTANSAVPNRRFRPRFFARPGAGAAAARAPLIDLRRVVGRRLTVRPPLTRHYYVENAAGVRLADLHPGRSGATVVLPSTGRLFVRDPRGHAEYALPEAPRVLLAQLSRRPITSRSRGAEHEAFRRLFSRPFDADAIARYRAAGPTGEPDLPPGPGASRWLRPALGLLSVAALATGAIFTGVAASERGDVDADTPHRTRVTVNERIDRFNAIAVTSYIVGGVAAAGYLTWTFWPREQIKIEVAPSAPSAGATMRVSF